MQSLEKGITTAKSDVWSMGIVLWEISTFGGSPYVMKHRTLLPNTSCAGILG